MGGGGICMGGGMANSFKPLPENELRALQCASKALDIPFKSPVADLVKSIAIGPKIRQLAKWSKQTEYGGEV